MSHTRPVRTPGTGRRDRTRPVRIVAAVLITLVMAFPFYWMVLTAFSSRQDIYAPGLHWFPAHPTTSNFSVPFHAFAVTRWLRNSALITVLVTAITVVANLLAGFAFAKIPFRGRGALFLLVLSTMMIPVQAIMVAQFKLVVALHLFGSIWAVVIPASASAFGVFLARQFFLAIPDELLEAGRVDGAGPLRIFVSIVLPLCRPLIAVLTLLTFMYNWNDFTWPLIALFSDPAHFTMPIGLATDIKGQYSTDYGSIMAMSLVMALPMMVLFVVFQRFFVQGLARTGIR